MGRLIDMPLPRLGETMEEGRITAWLKQPGEAFKRGETILEVETDKTVVEVPALMDGTLREQVAGVDDRIAIDGVIARIEVEGEATTASPPPSGGGCPSHPGQHRRAALCQAQCRGAGECHRLGTPGPHQPC